MRVFAIMAMMATLSLSAGAEPCRTAVRNGEAYDIDEPGRYCLEEDYAAPALFDWHAMRKAGYEGVIYLRGSQISVDFKGHAITIGSGANFFISETDHLHRSHWPTDLSIQNGKLKGPATFGVYLGNAWISSTSGYSAVSLLSDIDPKRLNDNEVIPVVGDGKTYGEATRERFFRKRQEMPPAGRFPHGGYVLENMTIRLTHSEESIGALLGGADNIVRHCTIEVDGAIGLYLVGPHALVEDNTIIIRGEAAPVREANAAIKLDRADGSVIRNNRIVIKNGPAAPLQGVSLIESVGVTLENNIVYGNVPTMVKAFDKQSRWTESGTQRKSAMQWWFD